MHNVCPRADSFSTNITAGQPFQMSFSAALDLKQGGRFGFKIGSDQIGPEPSAPLNTRGTPTTW